MNTVSDPVSQNLILDLKTTITLFAFFIVALSFLARCTQKYKAKALKFIYEKLKQNLPPVLNVDKINPIDNHSEFLENFRDSLRISGVKTTIHKKLPRDFHHNTIRYLLFKAINFFQSTMLICFPCCAALLVITVFDHSIYKSYIRLGTINNISLLLAAFVVCISFLSCFVAYIEDRS